MTVVHINKICKISREALGMMLLCITEWCDQHLGHRLLAQKIVIV